MSKLITADFFSSTGYCNSAIRIAEALSLHDDVACRHFKLAGQFVPPPAKTQELLKKSINKIDTNLLVSLPPFFAYKGGIKNIGVCFSETTNYKTSGWAHHINVMDELFVCSENNKSAAIESGVKIPIKVIPLPCNKDLYNKSYERIDVGQKNKYMFLCIADYSAKKDIVKLITAYLEEFSSDDNCVLVLKSYVEGCGPKESIKLISEDITKIKQGLRKWGVDRYPKIILLPEYMDNETIARLQYTSDCFVTAERGSGWNICLHDAICFGKWTISSGWGSHTEYVEQYKHGALLDYKMVTAKHMHRCPFAYNYSCHEKWSDVDPEHLKYEMRMAYDNKYIIKEETRQEFINKFCYENAGLKIKEML